MSTEHLVAQFPDFQPLLLTDKEAYMAEVANFPRISDLSFSTLQIWWNLGDKLETSKLLGNLVISYSQPFEEDDGLTLVGEGLIDESIQTIFGHQISKGLEPKLIHVPEFVADQVKDSDKYTIEPERDYDEYLISSQATVEQSGGNYSKLRYKIKQFEQFTVGKEVVVKPVDLAVAANREQLYASVASWISESKSNNDPDSTELVAIQKTLELSEILGIENLCLYVDGELMSVVLYDKTDDGQYLVAHHLKENGTIPNAFDYMTKCLAQCAVEDNVPFINFEMDLGVEGLRRHKLSLRPVDFFRKFTILPKQA